ncbi:MAG: bifunctional ornithine acetyltransferase/N-acetylglutamate synthase, partial [Acidimicrobiales bacterium]
MSTISSPLAPEAFPALPGVAGVRLATLAAGLRYRGRADLMLATFAEGTTAAGTFTRSLCS